MYGRAVLGLTRTVAPAERDGIAEIFNCQRVAMKTPAMCYRPAPRSYAGLPPIDYPLHDRDLIFTACGRICLHKKKINLSTVLAGQRVGLKEVDDAIWLISFMDCDLGYIDLEQWTLQPLDNPFGLRLLPMS